MQAVILDIDGTLLHSAEDDDRLYREAVRSILGDVRMRPSLGQYDPVSDSGILEQILADNGMDPERQSLEAVRSEFADRVAGFVAERGPFRPLPGAREFVTLLRSSPDRALAFATGGWRVTADLKLRSAGFDIDGLPLASSDDATRRSDIMRVALDALGGPFDSVVYYGDGAWDRRACAELGWKFCAVGRALGGIEDFHAQQR